MSEWKGDCWAKWRYCGKSACSKSKTVKERQFTTSEQMDSFRNSTSNWFWIVPTWPSAEDCRTTRFVIWEVFYWWNYETYLWGINQICNAISKGNNSFTIDINTLKAFIAILLVNDYLDLPRQPMYWEHNEDTHNAIVSSLLSRNRFDETMQDLHLADNSSLDKEDKFAKVRPLINKVNEQCLADYLPE